MLQRNLREENQRVRNPAEGGLVQRTVNLRGEPGAALAGGQRLGGIGPRIQCRSVEEYRETARQGRDSQPVRFNSELDRQAYPLE